MDDLHFDALTRSLTSPETRRRFLTGLAALPVVGGLLGILDMEETDAHGRRKRRKKAHKHGKGRRRKHKHKRKKPQPQCTPACEGGLTCREGVCGVACGSDFCPAASEICVDGACTACTVTCAASNHTCDGAALQAALEAGGNVYVCPGRYTGNFVTTPFTTLTLVGAGNGTNPASATILDVQGVALPTLIMNAMVKSTVKRVRIVGKGDCSGGVFAEGGSESQLTDCAIVGGGGATCDGAALTMVNTSIATLTGCFLGGGTARKGGAIYANNASVTLDNTEISGNTAEEGGGVYLTFATLNVKAGSRITGNTATKTDAGGGIFTEGSSNVTIATGATVSGNTPNNCEPAVGTCT